MKTLFILSILFLGSEMQTAHAIRNGRAAPRGKFASVGFINPACTGTLINENTVITANHCLMGSNTLKYNSFVLAINGVEKTFKTVQFKVLSTSLNRELALLRIDKKITGIDFPPLASRLPVAGDLVTGIGFGATGTLPSALRDKKQIGFYKVFDTPSLDWNDRLGPIEMIAVKSANSDKQIPCVGDSGGPLFAQNGELLGIISFGQGAASDKQYASLPELTDRCLKTVQANYVAIAPNLDWIHKTLDKMGH